MADAIECGMSEYDMLKGDPSGYKQRWSGRTRRIQRVRIAHPQPKEALYGAAGVLFAGLRRIKHGIQRAVRGMR